MRNWILRIAGGIIGVVVVLVAAAAVMLATFDPNAQKDRITAAVKEQTGRDLTIAGDISISVFPVLGFEAQGVQLGNPPDFTEKDFISVGKASAGVRLMPLLARNIEITDIVLQQPHINIIRRQDGTTNLAPPARTAQKSGAVGKEATARAISFDSIKIEDASVVYTDRLAGNNYTVDPLNMTVPAFAGNKETDFLLDFVLKNANTGQDVAVDFEASLKADPAATLYELTNFKGNATLKPQPDAEKIRVSFSGKGRVNTGKEIVAFDDLQVMWPDPGSAKGSEAKGRLSVAGFVRPDIDFSLAVSKLNLDMFGAKQASGGAHDATAPLLPIDMMRNIRVNGDATVNMLKAAGLTVTAVEAKIAANMGLVSIDPLRLLAYGGTQQGKIIIDAGKSSPEFRVSGDMRNIDLGAVLRDRTMKDYVTGRFNADYNLVAFGNSVEALKETAGGALGINLADGKINKWQLSRFLNQAIAFFETGNVSGSASDTFRFTSMDASWSGNNGRFENNDLVLVAPASHALGSGSVNLRENTVDYSLRVGLGDDPASFEKAKRLPIVIRGPLDAPGYSLDFEAIAAQALKDRMQGELEKSLGAQEPAAGGGIQEKLSPSGVIKDLLNKK